MAMSEKTVYITKAAVIAALYAALTLLGAAFGLSYGAVQLRFSEALCVLPLFTSCAIPGLTAGCFAANLLSTVSPLDTVAGTLATLGAALLTRCLRNVRLKTLPICSILMPVIFNGIIVGAEIAFFSRENGFLSAFALNGTTVAFGELAVMLSLGIPLYLGISKNTRLKKILRDSPETGNNMGRNTAEKKRG